MTLEGTRPILVEVQALVCKTNFNLPRRTVAGTDYNRVNLILAVLEKRLGIGLSGCDVYVNVAGGMRVTEPALDMGIALSVLSGYANRPLPKGTAAFGEIGLIGEVRSAGADACPRSGEARLSMLCSAEDRRGQNRFADSERDYRCRCRQCARTEAVPRGRTAGVGIHFRKEKNA